MKTILTLLVLTFLLVGSPGRCFAMMGIEEVSPARAKELGLEIRSTPAGPDAVWISLEFEAKGDLKKFNRVDLEVNDGGKLLLHSSLREDHSKPGRVVVSFTADRAHLDSLMLRVVTGDSMDMTGHDLHLKDFVEPGKGR